MEGNDGSLPAVVSLGGLLSSLPIEKRIECEVLPAVGVEFKSGCAESSGPKPTWLARQDLLQPEKIVTIVLEFLDGLLDVIESTMGIFLLD